MSETTAAKPAFPIPWPQLIGIDLRSLALFRIAIAIAVLVDLASFWPNLRLFLSDEGVYPRFVSIIERSQDTFSLFYIVGSYPLVFLLFTLTALAAIALLVGYHTRIASVVCWLMIASLNARAMPFLSSADVQLVVMMFWAMFLPLGARFSIDQALSREKSEMTGIASAASLALLLQVTYLYLMGALLKTGPAWQDMTAVQAALSAVHIRSSLAHYLLQFPELAKYITWYVYHLELYAVFFLFCPFFNQPLRLIMFVLLAGMHVGFHLFLSIGYFPLVSISGLTIFLPALFWDRLGGWMERKFHLSGHAIYYDEPCDFCRKTCLIFREISLLSNASIEPAQHYPDIYAVMQEHNSWVVKTPDGRTLLHWEAVAYLWRRSPLLAPLGLLFLPPFMRPVGEAMYRFIARHRGKFGAVTARLLPYRERVALRPSAANSTIVTALMIVTLLLNLKGLDIFKPVPFPKPLAATMQFTRLWQKWSMFAPYPYRSSRWTAVEGHLSDGTVVDLLFGRAEPPVSAMPASGEEAYPSWRWRKFFSFYRWDKSKKIFGKAFCRRWESERRTPSLKRVVVIS
jgi:predicted DCC family thiol-disulfide oxidoreductase YuxK